MSIESKFILFHLPHLNKHFRGDGQVGDVNFGSALLGNFLDLTHVLTLGVTVERRRPGSGRNGSRGTLQGVCLGQGVGGQVCPLGDWPSFIIRGLCPQYCHGQGRGIQKQLRYWTKVTSNQLLPEVIGRKKFPKDLKIVQYKVLMSQVQSWLSGILREQKQPSSPCPEADVQPGVTPTEARLPAG